MKFLGLKRSKCKYLLVKTWKICYTHKCNVYYVRREVMLEKNIKRISVKEFRNAVSVFLAALACLGTAELVSDGIEAKASDIYIVSNGESANRERIFTTVAYSGGNLTASGMPCRRDPNGLSTVAVDPSVIPYGTAMYIEGYGYAVAADCGTAIKGNMIDLFFNSYQESCDWGLKQSKVTILGDSSGK